MFRTGTSAPKVASGFSRTMGVVLALVMMIGAPTHLKADVVIVEIKADGHGFLAGMVNKLVSGTRVSTVTKVEFAPLADGLFVIPDGWKREKK